MADSSIKARTDFRCWARGFDEERCAGENGTGAAHAQHEVELVRAQKTHRITPLVLKYSITESRV